MVFVVDDDAGVRQSMRYLFRSVRLPCRAYPSVERFLAAYRGEPGCLVLDLRMPSTSGMAFLESLRERGIELPVIVLTGYGDVPTAVRAMKRGAVDFLDKPPQPQQLIDAVQEALRRDAARRSMLRDSQGHAARIARLTAREREVAERAAAGATSREIAAALGLSVRTVEGHRRRVLAKTHCRNAAQLARLFA